MCQDKIPSRIEQIQGRQLDAIPIVQDTARLRQAYRDIGFLLKLLEQYGDTIAFYAEPEIYHGVAFISDPPAGEFAEDFGAPTEHGHPLYPRPMPGLRARQTLKEACRIDEEEADDK